MRGEHQHNETGIVDRPNDLAGVEGTRHDISGGHPASHAGALQGPDDGVGDGGVLGGVADKDGPPIGARCLLPDAFDHAPSSCRVRHRRGCYPRWQQRRIAIPPLSHRKVADNS
jgi:hypothetical protein